MSRRGFALVSLVLLTAGLSACGNESRSTESPTPRVRGVATPNRHCEGLSKAKQTRQLFVLERDLRNLRAAAATVKGHSQDGNAAINAALDRFLLDVGVEALPVHRRSDFIDHAAAIVVPRCYQCFQALEANRPIAAGAKLPCG